MCVPETICIKFAIVIYFEPALEIGLGINFVYITNLCCSDCAVNLVFQLVHLPAAK